MAGHAQIIPPLNVGYQSRSGVVDDEFSHPVQGILTSATEIRDKHPPEDAKPSIPLFT